MATEKRTRRYALGGVVIVYLFVLLARFAFHKEPLIPEQSREPGQPPAQHNASSLEPAAELPTETTTNLPSNDSITTNAAVLYRQAFELFDALSKEQKELVSSWRTNVDASIEAELCQKTQPICDLMHQALTATSCDWGIDPITFGTQMPYLSPARNIARAAIWNAAHCRSNDVTGATEDVLATLQVGHAVSRSALIGCLVDMSLQNMVSSYVTQHLGLFSGADGQRLAVAFADPSYGEVPSRAMEQEADIMERMAVELASLPDADIEKGLSALGLDASLHPDSPELDRAAELAWLNQVADSERELAKALASSSEDDYEACLKHSTELQVSNPLAKMLTVDYDRFVDKARYTEINRAMVVAGLAVAENGTEALAAHPDPASGKPFVYTKTDDGFELQSSFVFNDEPYKIRFK